MRFLLILAVVAAWPVSTKPAPEDELAAKRQKLIEHLRAYREAARFPLPSNVTPADLVPSTDIHSADAPAVHSFIGPNQSLCALAYLIAQSGRRDLVDQVARDNNHLCVADVKSGPVMEWIRQSGLTFEECVLIQQPSREPVRKEDPNPEVRRIQAHLDRVEEKLVRETKVSLIVATARLRMN
jgi:hypothetical protein